MDAAALDARITQSDPDVQTTQAYGLPHPSYAPESWVRSVSPGPATFESTALPLLTEAHALATRRRARKEA
jgi:hypothetical protein